MENGKSKNDYNKYWLPPYKQTYVTNERVIVEENKDSTLIAVESEYRTIITRNQTQPPGPISVTKICGDIDTWRIIGNHMTLSNGRIDINITKFLNCSNIDYSIESDLMVANLMASMPIFIATAQSNNPVFLTYELDISDIQIVPSTAVFFPNPAVDVDVIVRSWRHDGTPAPSIQFSWMAICEKTNYASL